MVELLPYQDDITLPTDNSDPGSTKILDSAMTAQSRTNSAMRHSREVFMAGKPPQIPMLNPPDIQDREEIESNISPDAPALNRETDEQRIARERKNKARQVLCNRARHRKEEWEWYEVACPGIEQRLLAVEAAYEQR
jgi:hypothetical protein